MKTKISVCAFILLGLFLILNTACKKTPPITPPAPETGTLNVEGVIYKTVKIGNQWWMAEDLKVTKYRNGDPIPQIADAAEWKKDTAGAYCIYDSGRPKLLYNWYVVNDPRNIAPVGWHVPSDNEWKELEKHLGMNQEEVDKVNFRGTNEGKKLKSADAPNGWGTNETGFNALSDRCRLFTGAYGDGGTAFWWAADTETSGMQAWYRYLDHNKDNVFRFYGNKKYGFSIRCVKD